jgi:hypothetical protein
MADKSYVFLPDIHYGFERVNGKKVPLHNQRILDAVGIFLDDFKPDYLIYGGDTLDCGPVSHHNRGKNFSIEGLRLLSDADGLSTVMRQFRLAAFDKDRGETHVVYIKGNHEAWLDDLVEDYPGLAGSLDIPRLLNNLHMEMIPQGGVYKLGKLHFLHGDQVRSSLYPSRWAVDAYEKSVRFGHFHTYQTFTKVSALDATDARTGVAVPCLCNRGPGYGKGAPNRWLNGFNYGYVESGGTYFDMTPIITNSKFVAEGVEYAG